MADPIQTIIDGAHEKTTDHVNAVSSLVRLIDEAFPGELDSDAQKKIEAFVGRIIADVESEAIDPYTAVTSLSEARKLAEAGVADFVDLIQIGAE